MRRLIEIIIVVLLMLVVTSQAVPVSVSYGPFDVTFYNSSDGDGLYTGAQNWTGEQMYDVGSSIGVWDSGINNVAGRQVQIHVFWGELDYLGANVLGVSGSYRVADGTTMWNIGEYVWKEGDDYGPIGLGLDAIMLLDITAAGTGGWNFGSEMPMADEIDFRSVITHEIGHSLGWSSSYDPASDTWGRFGNRYVGLTAWDRNLVDGEGDRPAGRGHENFDEQGDPVYWDGANAVDYFGGLVPI